MPLIQVRRLDEVQENLIVEEIREQNSSELNCEELEVDELIHLPFVAEVQANDIGRSIIDISFAERNQRKPDFGRLAEINKQQAVELEAFRNQIRALQNHHEEIKSPASPADKSLIKSWLSPGSRRRSAFSKIAPVMMMMDQNEQIQVGQVDEEIEISPNSRNNIAMFSKILERLFNDASETLHKMQSVES